MMKTKVILTLLILSCLPMNAQKKLFTLEDLNFGGPTTVTRNQKTAGTHGGVTN